MNAPEVPAAERWKHIDRRDEPCGEDRRAVGLVLWGVGFKLGRDLEERICGVL